MAQVMGASESQGALLIPRLPPQAREPQLPLPLQEYIQKLMPPLIDLILAREIDPCISQRVLLWGALGPYG